MGQKETVGDRKRLFWKIQHQKSVPNHTEFGSDCAQHMKSTQMPVGWIEDAGMQGAGVLRVPVGVGSVRRHVLRHLPKQKELNPAPGANRCTFQINHQKKTIGVRDVREKFGYK